MAGDDAFEKLVIGQNIVVHELITKPHLGSRILPLLAPPSGTDPYACLRGAFETFDQDWIYSLNGNVRGAMRDLAPGTAALSALSFGSNQVVPILSVAGSTAGPSAASPLAYVCPSDPLVGDLLSWAASVFGGEINDGIVGEASQLASTPALTGNLFPGTDHSDNLSLLGFPAIGELDSPAVAQLVVQYLNSPYPPGTAPFWLGLP